MKLKTNFFEDKNLLKKINNIILTSSWGIEFPFFHYRELGLGNLILTYLYALHLKYHNKSIKIIPFYPLRIERLSYFSSSLKLLVTGRPGGLLPIKQWYNRSSLNFNYKTYHLKRLSYINLYGKNGKISKESFFKKEDLFLSTHIMNCDNNSYKKISQLNLKFIKKNITSFINFEYKIKKKNNLSIINDGKRSVSIGLHLRRGDFKKEDDLCNQTSQNFPNIRVNIKKQIDIIKIVKSKVVNINIYSDQPYADTLEEIGNELVNYKINLFPPESSGLKVLEDMMKNDIIILSNSTLSIVSCILSNQLALYKNQFLPSRIQKFFKNIKEIK
jgi:hypothetical protein